MQEINRGVVSKYFFTLLIVCGALLWGCDEEPPVIEIPVNSEQSEHSLEVLSELISTFDVVQDVVTRSDLFHKKDDSFLPSTAVVYPIDTSFRDGDGVGVMIDFGDLGEAPHGVLCKDHKYRAGKIWISLNRPYNENDARLSIVFDENDPFYTGDGDIMGKQVGSITVTRASDHELLLQASELNFTMNDMTSYLSTSLSITHLEENGDGMIADKVAFSGNLSVKQGVDTVNLSSVSPLIKTYTLECAKHIVKGKLAAEISSNASQIEIDFDPFEDKACDNKYRLTINGKSVIQEY